MLQTSYFSSKAPNARKVAIAKYTPRYWNGPRAPRLAPPGSYPNWSLYSRQHIRQSCTGF